MDPSELKILQELTRQNERLVNQVTTLVGTMVEVQSVLRKNQEEGPGRTEQQQTFKLAELRTFKLAELRARAERGEHVSSEDLESLLENQYSRATNFKPGVGGLISSLGRSRFPNREQTIGRAAYGTSFLGGGSRLDKFRFGMAVIGNATASKHRRADQSAYDPETGERVPYSSGKFSDLSEEHQEELMRSEAFGEDLSQIDPETLSPKEQILYGQATGELTAKGKARKRPATAAEKAAAQAKYGGKFAEDIFGKSKDMTAYAAEAPGAVAKISSSGKLFDTIASASELGMAASEFIAGPAAVAYEAVKEGYNFTKGTLYDPARSAAGLGYGFSNTNPFTQGASVSLNRSIQTRLDALGSMGLSQEQTAAARASLEGMGVGGPGSEKMYNDYYGSMKNVIQNTQLSAQTLSPFYEQFMRQGGQGDEVQKLTKMLSEDLPKAAAASRMSLEGMAQMIQKTTDAVSQSPYNVRTKSQISQSLVDAQMAGAPVGMSSISGGSNALITAQTASRLGINYFQAMQQSSQLDITAAESLQSTLGPGVKTADDFDKLMADPQGSMKIMMAQAMTGMSVDDMRKLYSQGIDSFVGAQALQSKLGDSNLGAKSSVTKTVGHATARGVSSSAQVQVGTSQMIKGTNIDLYQSNGKDLRLDKQYTPVIKTLEDSLKKTDPGAEKDFEKQLKELSGKPAKATWDLLQKEAKKVEGDAATGNGQITLSDEARKFFKLNFKANGQPIEPPNAGITIGGHSQGIG